MKAIIGDYLYDTDKAEAIYNFRRKHVVASIFLPEGTGFIEWHDVTLYKTPKGAYFETEEYREETTLTPIDESAVRDILSRLSPDRYMEIFGEVEEA